LKSEAVSQSADVNIPCADIPTVLVAIQKEKEETLDEYIKREKNSNK